MPDTPATFDARRFQQVRWATYAILILAYMSVFFTVWRPRWSPPS